jgi:uncharacterized protein (TIRG00374 family)
LKKRISLFLRLGISIALMAVVFRRVPLRNVLGLAGDPDTRLWLILSCFGICGALQTIVVLRWHLLLRSQGMRFGYWDLFKLTFIGNFFNNCMPGLTGGDLFKAYYVWRRTDQKMKGVVSVFMDRLIGLFALGGMVLVLLFFAWGDPRFGYEVRVLLYLLIASFLLAGGFFSRTLRGWLRLDRWLPRLPGGRLLQEIDQAVFLYRGCGRVLAVALGLSFLNHLQYTLIQFGYARALGFSGGTVWDFLFLVPVVTTIKALPVSIMGLGVGEWIYPKLFAKIGMPAEVAVAISLLATATYVLWSLPGGIFLMFEGKRASAEEMQAAIS